MNLKTSAAGSVLCEHVEGLSVMLEIISSENTFFICIILLYPQRVYTEAQKPRFINLYTIK